MKDNEPKAIGRVVVDVFDNGLCSLCPTRYARITLHGILHQQHDIKEIGAVVQEEVNRLVAETKFNSDSSLP